MNHAALLWLSLAADFADITVKNSAMLFEGKQWRILETSCQIIPEASAASSLCFRSPATPSVQVVPRRFDGKRRIVHNLFRDYRHFANSLLESVFGGLVRLAHLEVVRHEFFADIDGKNLGPWPTPHTLRKHIVIWAQFTFDLPCQCSSQSAVSSIRETVFLKICSKFGSTSHGLEPLELVAGAADQAQYTSGHTNGKWSSAFIAAYIGISKLRRVEANDLKKLWHDTVRDCFSGEGLRNQFGIVGISQLDQGRPSKVGALSDSLNERLEWFGSAEPPDY
jgi:hypothetical protein